MPKPNSKDYPAPVVIAPTSSIHKTTLIVLHGRGGKAERFAAPLLENLVSPLASTISEPQSHSFHSYFPHTKFIFPTASLRRAVAYNRSLIHQWFDMYPLDRFSPEHKQHVQLPGLRESVVHIHGLLKEATEEVGTNNVVLMGLSQGCAVGLLSLMLWRGEALGAFVGMCGWLPLRKSMLESLEPVDVFGEDGGDVFERDDMEEEEEEEDTREFEQAVEWLSEELELPRSEIGLKGVRNISVQQTPVFLGHGIEDERVPCRLGKQTVELLSALGMDAEHREYEGLGHWYSEDMLRDIVDKLKQQEDHESDAEK